MTLRITPELRLEFRRFNAAQQKARDAYARLREAENDLTAGRRGKPRAPINHGTEGGYRTHRRRGEDACPECKRAAATVDKRRKKK